ncbi:hypothetical protein GGF46_000284 [Coemansia sp. RSA 552]|nr:hypothetical protein GGF46_000284 [Coemansia sp. RSA 552]
MTSCRASNLLLSSAILPRQLDIFHVCFAEGAIATLVNTRLDVSEWQEIGQCFGQGVVDETNQLFGRLSHKYYSILRITRQMELPNWREIQWAGLCELSIDTAVGMQALVDLVAVLPGLQRLEVLDVDIGSTQPIDFPRDKPHSECAWRGLEPLRTSTSKLRFGYFMSRYTKEDAGAVVMYLMIRMPELKTIMIPERLHEYAHSVKALARWYPHLQHIKTYI